MNQRRNFAAAVVASLIIALLLCVPYGGGYFALSVKHSGATSDDWCRIFKHQWLVEFYKPAAKVESVLTRDEVTTYWQPDPS
jgi:hypothetical protein